MYIFLIVIGLKTFLNYYKYMGNLQNMTYLKQIVKNFLNFLDNENISSLEDIDSRLNTEFPLGEDTKDLIFMELIYCLLSQTYTLSYISPGFEIPLEVKINMGWRYTDIIARTTEKLPGYKTFIEDPGGITQAKIIPTIDLDEIKEELRNLESLVPYVG